ncbi:hypothetical protein DSCW_48450 [Desulfosarcina widdelii]|uniref:Uncharacterized protein n=1 Tax=Desulfosarcina widdelii TaxID=947919 RepID=A0A5K7Z8P4_9BACT|nr:hypothetical protein DSCW_48450 [Desulfosarcina widdelii]
MLLMNFRNLFTVPVEVEASAMCPRHLLFEGTGNVGTDIEEKAMDGLFLIRD